MDKGSVPAILALLGFLMAAPANAGQAQEPGDTFRDCVACPEMVVLPAGAFVMGTDGRHEYERPAHRVTLDRAFAMGKFELTFEEWGACFDDGGCGRMPDDHKWGRGRRPVINITWNDTKTYVEWLGAKTGKTYRLPTEAEWEYAAHAGTTSEFSWGDEVGKNLANCRDCGSKWSQKESAPVGSFAPNPFGLHDMHGNIWEWVEDCWTPSHQGAPADGRARLDGDCRNRVMRGGSWYYFSKNARSTWRFKNDARVKSYGIGMRVVRELP